MMMKNISFVLRMSSFTNAWKGVVAAWNTELHVRIHFLAAVVVVLAGLLLHVSLLEWIMLLVCIGMVVTAELVNTAIEKLVDMVSPDYQTQAGFIKDVAAGAVLVSAIVSFVIALLIFIPRI
jgi:diacylglycerol kinase (ATP)